MQSFKFSSTTTQGTITTGPFGTLIQRQCYYSTGKGVSVALQDVEVRVSHIDQEDAKHFLLPYERFM